ncbi:hypothetical protein NC652_005581 [Populus alba x Populus x berolinensis]|nr:hypothetical protein NC652_005581 [Populus alba x Populus x berolinensis]
MDVIDTLSTHSPDEECIGERQQPSIWTGDAEIIYPHTKLPRNRFWNYKNKIK